MEKITAFEAVEGIVGCYEKTQEMLQNMIEGKPISADEYEKTNLAFNFFFDKYNAVKEKIAIATKDIIAEEKKAVFEIRNEVYFADEFPFEKEHLSIAYLEISSGEDKQYASLIYTNDDDYQGFMLYGEFTPSRLQAIDREGEVIIPPYLENVLLKDEDVLGKGANEIYTMLSEFSNEYAEFTLPTDITDFLKQKGVVIDYTGNYLPDEPYYTLKTLINECEEYIESGDMSVLSKGDVKAQVDAIRGIYDYQLSEKPLWITQKQLNDLSGRMDCTKEATLTLEEANKMMKEQGGNLFLSNNGITELPDNLVVEGNLILAFEHITKLPDNLKVGRKFEIFRTPVTKLPDDLEVGGELRLHGVPIAELPCNLKVGGSLVIDCTKITELPEGLVINGNLEIIDTEMTRLPDNLTVNGSFELNSVPITELPDNLKVKGDINLFHTLITKLPDNLTVGGKLFSDTPLENEQPVKKKSDIERD